MLIQQYFIFKGTRYCLCSTKFSTWLCYHIQFKNHSNIWHSLVMTFYPSLPLVIYASFWSAFSGSLSIKLSKRIEKVKADVPPSWPECLFDDGVTINERNRFFDWKGPHVFPERWLKVPQYSYTKDLKVKPLPDVFLSRPVSIPWNSFVTKST